MQPKGISVGALHARDVLALGEATGHAHTLDAQDCRLVTDDEANELYLIVYGETRLEHQEHDAITLAAGTYLVGSPDRRAGIAQVEYTPAELRNVAD